MGAYVANGLQAGTLTGVVYFLSQLFGGELALAPLAIGALFVLFTAPQLANALSASRLVRAFGVRPELITGLSRSIIGLVLLALAASMPAISAVLFVGMVLAGLGAGVVHFGVNVTVMSSTEGRFAGAASGVVQTSVQLGGSIGIAVLVLARSLTGTTGAFFVAAVFLVLAIGGISLRDRTAAPRAATSVLSR